MKMLIVGGSGMIGTKIHDHFCNKNTVEMTYLTHKIPFGTIHQLDILERENTINLIRKINPDVVVHNTALVSVDLCETDKNLANMINVEGTKNVIEGCKITNSKIVFISTPLVFNGEKDEYVENDAPSPISQYGITKLEGEKLIEKSGVPYLILRTDQPYCWIETWQHTNSVLRLVDTLKEKKTLREITDWYNNPTYVPDIAIALEKLLENEKNGIYHVVGTDFINRFEWGLITSELFGLDKKLLEPITSDSLDLAVKRSNANLSNRKLVEDIGFSPKGVKEGIQQMLKDKK
ncbi:hypothetical protein C5F47_00730 [Nitrosopumilus cobalaminigenes]|uniref:RmlD-like substrate binding domain-containing protein n=1 Tax=Nitrosopumilus cobalaminigenes TaxID=1470066 RepID=A0A7D5M181_9ARCH|nr:NAD(P)-dependent oxidoreductase [Nitrosopumilus cobalaminigenes]QLH02207.1 hypothetical protein C5F47_00730 [Nitrosopumilus cobalaminigenes]